MPPRRAALTAVLGVLILALLVVIVFLVGRGSQAGGAPLSAATAVTQATEAPTPTAAPPTATPTAVTATASPAGAPAGQTIVTFVVPSTIKCDAADQGTPQVHLVWTTLKATGVTISIDGPGKYADYGPNGSTDVPFACSVAQHTYLLTTRGPGTPATRTVVVRRVN